MAYFDAFPMTRAVSVLIARINFKQRVIARHPHSHILCELSMSSKSTSAKPRSFSYDANMA
jgi:hypothetical protein